MISVIIPVYNVKAYLEEAIDGVIHQTYQDLEIILVDDGSTDGSGEVCDEYVNKDERIKVIHQENKGLSAARNAGLDICQGEVISFLDSDDVFDHDMLRRMLEVMNQTEAEIVECDILEYESKRPLKPNRASKAGDCLSDGLRIYDTREALYHQLTGEIFNSVWNKVYKRRIWERLRFREGKNYEDFDIILPLLSRAEKICVIDEGLVLYRKRPESITCTNSVKNTRNWLEAQKHYLEYVEKNIPVLFTEGEYESVLCKRYPFLIRKYFLCTTLREIGKKELIDELKAEIYRIKRKIPNRRIDLKARIATFMVLLLTPSVAGWFFRKIKRC